MTNRFPLTIAAAILLLFAVLPGAAAAQAVVTVDFHNLPYPDGTILTTEFQSSGLIFSDESTGMDPSFPCPALVGQENQVQDGSLFNLYRIQFATVDPVVDVVVSFRDHASAIQLHELFELDGSLNIGQSVSYDDANGNVRPFSLHLANPAGIAGIAACEQPLGAEAILSITMTTQPDPICRTETHLCLNDERFKVEVEWMNDKGEEGTGHVVDFSSDDSGLFWFFSPSNWEMMVKVLDGCGLNDHFWVFAAATTNVEYTLTVTDRKTGQVQEYFNPLGNSAAAVTDTGAFASCP